MLRGAAPDREDTVSIVRGRMRNLEPRRQCPLFESQISASHYSAHLRRRHGATLPSARAGQSLEDGPTHVAAPGKSAEVPSSPLKKRGERTPRASAQQARDTSSRAIIAAHGRELGRGLYAVEGRLLASRPKAKPAESAVVVREIGGQFKQRCHMCGAAVRRDRMRRHLQKVHSVAPVSVPAPGTPDREPKRIRVEKRTRRKPGGEQLSFQCDKCGQAVRRGVSTKRFGVVCFDCAGLGRKAVARRMGGKSTSVRTISTPAGGQSKWKR